MKRYNTVCVCGAIRNIVAIFVGPKPQNILPHLLFASFVLFFVSFLPFHKVLLTFLCTCPGVFFHQGEGTQQSEEESITPPGSYIRLDEMRAEIAAG